MVDIEHTVDPADIDETRLAKEDATEYVQRLSRQKAETIASKYPNNLIIGADTAVLIGDNILGKPQDKQEARSMLQRLNGAMHTVITGVTVVNTAQQKSQTISVETQVWMRTLSDKEIETYVSSNEPYDKAGGYGIQGKAAHFVERISGDYYNVVGLPVSRISQMLSSLK